MTFKGEKLKKLREERGMTQAELADLLHVKVQSISQWENDIYKPKEPIHLWCLAIIFDCKPFDFLEVEEEDQELISNATQLRTERIAGVV